MAMIKFNNGVSLYFLFALLILLSVLLGYFVGVRMWH